MGLGTGNQSINIVTDLSQLKTWLIKWLANKKLEKVPKWLGRNVRGAARNTFPAFAWRGQGHVKFH